MIRFILSLLILGNVTFSVSAQTYQGASFKEVWQVVEDRNFTPRTQIEQKEFAAYQNETLPKYPVNLTSLFAKGDSALTRDAIRTTTERFDYYDRLPKKLHPHGVCIAGQWKILKNTSYSGMLATGATGLFIGRVSVALEETEVGSDRGFGIAGKVFPTMNQNKVVPTGNFFTIDVLTGTDLEKVLDAKTTNEPEVALKFGLIPLGLKVAAVLASADRNPGFRPLTQLASVGISKGQKVSLPKWIRLRVPREIHRNHQSDFRNEVIEAINENNGLKYIIEVSNVTKDRNEKSGWTAIGEIAIDRGIISYGCDRRLHFSHPKMDNN